MSELKTVSEILAGHQEKIDFCDDKFLNASVPKASAMLSAIKKAVSDKHKDNQDLWEKDIQLAVCLH